jgi:hypothetical protein
MRRNGQGKRPVKPLPRHAELAVNMAGSMATSWATGGCGKIRSQKKTEVGVEKKANI